MKEKVRRLIYLRKELEMLIDNEITDVVLRGREIDVEGLKESIIYHMDDNLEALKQGR